MLDPAHMTSLFENATEGIILTGKAGRIVLVNPAAEKIFGYKASELIGQSIEVLIPDKVKVQHEKLREGFYHNPSNRVMGHGRDLHGRNKEGVEIPLEVSLSNYERDGQMYVIAFIINITQRKEIEKSMLMQKAELEKITARMRQMNADLEVKVEERTLILKEALQKLEQSQQELSDALDKERQLNEIKSRFVAMASHEFRTPLTTILSSASLLSKYKETAEQDKREKHINRIKSSVNNLNDILEDFLSLGKLNEGKVTTRPETINLHETLAETLEEMQPLLKPGQYFVLESGGHREVTTDKKLFRNILFNLISNAIKFSDEGKPIKVTAEREKDRLAVSVTDEGIGIHDIDQEHLFSSFFRAANAVNIQGTGLGLHIVKRYLDLLDGDVRIMSELNRGTTITFSIPLHL